VAEQATIARPYARAAFDYARAGNALPAWSRFLAVASQVATDSKVAPLIGSPKVTPAKLTELIMGVAGAEAPANAINFAQLLADNRRLNLLPYIVAQYEQMRAAAEGTADVALTSAVALTAEQQAKFSAALTKRLKRTVKLHCTVDPNLIGGAVVRAGDFVIDGSLRGRLEKLTTLMSN
jgi:F-type H+-transporting ATPase subunit delta